MPASIPEKRIEKQSEKRCKNATSIILIISYLFIISSNYFIFLKLDKDIKKVAWLGYFFRTGRKNEPIRVKDSHSPK